MENVAHDTGTADPYLPIEDYAKWRAELLKGTPALVPQRQRPERQRPDADPDAEMRTFVDYCLSYYGEKGFYESWHADPMTFLEAWEAGQAQRAASLRTDDFFPWGNGDSIDRELVAGRVKDERLRRKDMVLADAHADFHDAVEIMVDRDMDEEAFLAMARAEWRKGRERLDRKLASMSASLATRGAQ